MKSNWTSLLTSIASRYFRTAPRSQHKRTQMAQPHVERLEDRLAPAVYNVSVFTDNDADFDPTVASQAD